MQKEKQIQELEIRIDRIQNELNVVSSSNKDSVERDRLLQVRLFVLVSYPSVIPILLLILLF